MDLSIASVCDGFSNIKSNKREVGFKEISSYFSHLQCIVSYWIKLIWKQ